MTAAKVVAGDIGRKITLTLVDDEASFEGADVVNVVATYGATTRTFVGVVSEDSRSVSYTTQASTDFPTPGAWRVRFDAAWADGRRLRGDEYQVLTVVT